MCRGDARTCCMIKMAFRANTIQFCPASARARIHNAKKVRDRWLAGIPMAQSSAECARVRVNLSIWDVCVCVRACVDSVSGPDILATVRRLVLFNSTTNLMASFVCVGLCENRWRWKFGPYFDCLFVFAEPHRFGQTMFSINW